MGKKQVQTLITSFIGKYKSIKKEDLNSTKDSQYENDSTASQQPVKIQETNLKIDSKIFDIKISPRNDNQTENLNNQETIRRRPGQILLTQMGFRTTGNQRSFHTICAECGLKLRNAKSKKLGFCPSCFKRHMERKPKK